MYIHTMECLRLIAVAGVIQTAFAAVDSNTLITRAPMIMAHDSATGYLGKGLVNGWAKTQSDGLVSQLECGARALDSRPMSKNGKLIWHHGGVSVNYMFETSVQDISNWLHQNPTELVLMVISDCEGDGCADNVTTALHAANVTSITKCTDLATMTLGRAKDIGALAGGGSLLAIRDDLSSDSCSNSHYDSTVACSGYLSNTPAVIKPLKNNYQQQLHLQSSKTELGGQDFFACWKTDKTKDIPVNHIYKYLDSVAAQGLSDVSFNQAQAIWQETTDSVVIGTLRESSLLKDETNSGLNAMLVENIKAKRWQNNISFIEINNVCDSGKELYAAIQAAFY
eukprot:m.10688 g.10688  ORF g.10688 m.10688 type:complete len:339 (+) comp8438_c0_seq1:171-1187(+)